MVILHNATSVDVENFCNIIIIYYFFSFLSPFFFSFLFLFFFFLPLFFSSNQLSNLSNQHKQGPTRFCALPNLWWGWPHIDLPSPKAKRVALLTLASGRSLRSNNRLKEKGKKKDYYKIGQWPTTHLGYGLYLYQQITIKIDRMN